MIRIGIETHDAMSLSLSRAVASALGQCLVSHQKHQRREGRTKEVVRKKTSFLFSSADGKIKKKRTMERKSDRISTGASSSSSFEPVIVDIGDGTNDNNDLSKGGGRGGGKGGAVSYTHLRAHET